MDPAERSLTAAFDRLARRARILAAAEAAGWGAAIAAASPLLGGVAAIAIGAARAVRLTRGGVIRRVDRAVGAANVFVTADELLRGTLTAAAAVRARVVSAASAALPDARPSGAIRSRRAWSAAVVAVVCWTVAGVMSMSRDRARIAGRDAGSRPAAASPGGVGAWRLTIAIEPPAYTGLPRTTIDDPAELRLLEGSTLDVRASRTIAIDHDGAASAARFLVTRSGYLVARAEDGSRKLVPIVATPDALPVVRLTTPGRDLVFANAEPHVAVDARATDDFGLRSLTLQYTKVSGAGEEYTFGAGEIPLALTRTSPREWSGAASLALSRLGMKQGDMLVYRASATDTKPGERQSTSDAFFIEISTLGVAAGDAFTLPEEETRYALSEQMLILKTERLNRTRGSMRAADVTEASMDLAVEQRTIRAEFVFMLGGEIEDEEVEAEQSIELQAGRLANRGQRDLRDATRAMSQAEKLLTGADPAFAIVAERTAVAALQRAFARDRYLLRALASRAQLDPSRRLTGNRAGAREVRAPLPRTPENRRAAQLQDLFEGVGELARDRRAGGSIDRARVVVFAEAALRVDPDSAVMRNVAADLQRGAFDAAAAAVAAESRRVLADAPLVLPSAAPALQRALDAARGAHR